MNLMPGGGLGILQTYRGCPFTCSFCEWGTMESPKRVRTADSLRVEFAAMERIGLGAALLADAGLNLNQAAFHNLRVAADRSGFLSRRGLICEVYPAKVRREHLDFLAGVGNAYVGVGLQSFDNKVLANVERKYDEARFDETLHALGEVATRRGRGHRRPAGRRTGELSPEFRAGAGGCPARCGSTIASCCRRRSWCARRPSIGSTTILCRSKCAPASAGQAMRWRGKRLS